MCGRYTLAKPIKVIKKHFDPVIIKCEHTERYNIAPGQSTPIIISQNDHLELKLMRWGLVPSWVKNIKTAKALTNARSETVHQKPSFKDSFKAHRCLVPADGFIEWKVQGKEKVPYYISLKSKNIFAFAGIWSMCDKKPSPAYTYSIITTQANSRLASIHTRMPVILAPPNYKLWLASETNQRTLRNLLRPFSTDNMIIHKISNAINSYKNDHEGLLNPLHSH